MRNEKSFENVREPMHSRNLSEIQIDAYLSVIILTCMEVGMTAEKAERFYLTDLIHDEDIWDVIWDKLEQQIRVRAFVCLLIHKVLRIFMIHTATSRPLH